MIYESYTKFQKLDLMPLDFIKLFYKTEGKHIILYSNDIYKTIFNDLQEAQIITLSLEKKFFLIHYIIVKLYDYVL
jgi:hypothetical protein